MAENLDPAGQSPVAPIPRRHVPLSPASPHAQADSGAREQLADIVDSVKVLADQLHHGDADDPADSAKDRAARRPKKFQRKGSQTDERRADDADNDPPDEPEPENADDAALNRSIAWPRLSRPSVPAALVRSKRKRRSTTVPLLILMGCNLIMLILGYFLAMALMSASSTQRATATSSNPTIQANTLPSAYRAAPGITDTAMDAADAALRAEKGNDLVVARRVYDDAIRLRLGLWGSEYRLALLAIKRGDLLDADLHLVHSTAAGECLGSCAFVRATFAGAKGNYAEAGRQCEAAAHVEPFNGKYFFCWGECLRRQGKPRAAVECIERALTRAFSAEEGDLYLFKIGLAKVESGNDEAFNASLANHLKKTDVSGDWWLLAAAQDLEHAAYPAAAEHLQKAAKALPAAVFDSRVRDYLFQAYAKRTEIAPFVSRPATVPATEAGASVMDPASWSPEKADPGNWPAAAR